MTKKQKIYTAIVLALLVGSLVFLSVSVGNTRQQVAAVEMTFDASR